MRRANPSRHTSSRGESLRQLRIIGGRWRGRKLAFAPVDGLRPTGDRIRETLFNWLAPELPGARCLDLFAGSGALGLEALSRGTGPTLLLERDRRVAHQLRRHLTELGADQGQVVEGDSLQWLHDQTPGQGFDLVFLDPPFGADLWQPTLDALQRRPWLAPGAAIYVESPKGAAYQTPDNWQLHRNKTTGQVNYRLYFAGAGEPER